MRVQLKKVLDGRPSLACIRPDGTRTWSRLHPFFPLHDLTHYAVESVLEFHEAFFGLVASGWEIDAFAQPGTASRIPREALVAETIVGMLDLERGTQRPLSGVAFSAELERALAGQGVPPFEGLPDRTLDRIRRLRDDLSAQWAALAPGETLELAFPAPNSSLTEEY